MPSKVNGGFRFIIEFEHVRTKHEVGNGRDEKGFHHVTLLGDFTGKRKVIKARSTEKL